MFSVSGDYEVQYRYRGLCPGRQDLANNHINPVIRSANLIVALSHQPFLLNYLLSFSSWIRAWKLNWQSEHFDLSRQAWQTFSIAFVMGISRAQAILRKVRDDFMVISGVYVIVKFTSFHLFCHSGFRKNQKGVGAIFFGTKCPSSLATGCQKRYFSLGIWWWQRWLEWLPGAGLRDTCQNYE